jgi:hypothetical protein
MQNLEDNLKRQGVRLREMPLVIQYNKRDLPNAMPVPELDAEINTMQVPAFESVATTGLGVEETLKGVTQLVLQHLIRKYGLEGSEPVEREIQILNAPSHQKPAAESLWDDDEEPLGATAPPRSAPPPPPVGEPEFELDEVSQSTDENIPLVATELLPATTPPVNPFDEMFSDSRYEAPMEVPTTSIEIPLPQGILESLPVLGQDAPATAVAARPGPERRATDGLVKEITIPLNLTMDEIRQHRRLRVKITLDVNLLP